MKRLLRERMARWIRRRQGLDVLPVTLQRRRLYIVPSRAGVAFGLLQILMLVAGLNYANSSALFVTFVLMGFTLVSMHQCHRNLLGVRVVAATLPPTFAHSPGTLTLVLENPSAATRYRIAAGLDDGPPTATDVPGPGRQTVALPVDAPRRGIVRVERILLRTRHPFGLFRTWTWIHAPLQLLVYPLPRGALPMPADSGERPGERPRASSGLDEWFGLRPFRDGDSPRQVDWKAYARESPLLVKEYSASASELRMFDFSALEGCRSRSAWSSLHAGWCRRRRPGSVMGCCCPG